MAIIWSFGDISDHFSGIGSQFSIRIVYCTIDIEDTKRINCTADKFAYKKEPYLFLHILLLITNKLLLKNEVLFFRCHMKRKPESLKNMSC